MTVSTSLRTRVVVPVFRRWDEADRLVTALSDAAVARAGASLVVVDDASMDGGADWLLARHPSLSVIVREENGGFASAVNTGLRDGDWDVAAIVNTDIRIDARTLVRLARMASDEAPVILGPRIVHAATGGDALWRLRFPTPASLFATYLGPLTRRRPKRFPEVRNGRVSVAWVEGACLVFSRQVYERVGPFDESYGMYSEEVAWQRRAATAGIPRVGLDEVSVFHGRIDEGPLAEVRKQRQLWRSRFRYIGEFHGAPVMWALRFALAAASPVVSAAAGWRAYLATRDGRAATRAARQVFGVPWLTQSDGRNFRELHDAVPRLDAADMSEAS